MHIAYWLEILQVQASQASASYCTIRAILPGFLISSILVGVNGQICMFSYCSVKKLCNLKTLQSLTCLPMYAMSNTSLAMSGNIAKPWNYCIISWSILTWQILDDICKKSRWGNPIYTLHSTNVNNEFLYLYKVMIPALSTTYTPAKLTRSIEEAKVIAADYSLVQLGYPMEGSSLYYLCST